ncbi:MAG: hypothetical protein P4L28_00725 [Paludibacteraceae bacterium]|nr:hypothetical protein [Paludibacteraceae bacterium]
MDELILKANKKVNFYFYIALIVALVLISLGYWLNKKFVLSIPAKTGVILSTITMLYLVLSIPFALWFCNKKIATLSLIENMDNRYVEYIKWIKIRMVAVSSNFLINIVLYYFMHTTSFVYAAGIGAIALIFCKPNKVTIEKELNPITETE